MKSFQFIALALFLPAFSGLRTVPAADDVAPSNPKARRALHAVTGDVARLGRGDLLEELQEILRELGSDEAEAKPWEKKAGHLLEQVKGEPKERAVQSAVKKLRRAVEGLAEGLGARSEGDAERLARLLLRLDSGHELAHAALGHERWNGSFAAPDEIRIGRGIEAMEAAANEASSLEVEVSVSRPSSSPLILKLYGEDSHSVTANGITLHGGIEAKRLERALRQAVRGLAFTNWVMNGKVAAPKLQRPCEISFTDNEPDYDRALDEAMAASWLTKKSRDRVGTTDLESFLLTKGGRCSRWRPECRISSLVHWDVHDDVLPDSIQPALLAGHINWVSLRFFGTGKPSVSYPEAEAGRGAGSTAKAKARTEALWRAASSGVFGARCWIRAQLKAGKSVSFSRSVLDHEGKISAEPLLVATLATEYLQATGEFKNAARSKPDKNSTIVAAMEKALCRPIPEFDDQWTACLMGEGPGLGILQRLEGRTMGPTDRDEVSEVVRAGVAYLAEVRNQAFAPLGVFAEAVEPFAELCEQNALHAAYLNLHPEQKSAWPDAHEQYPDQQGFTAKGAWGGSHSVIAYSGDAASAIDQWMGTFFHRLPLLEPGLCGTGLAIDEEVVVLDVNSLANQYYGEALVAWPADGMTDVPLAFVPELPNPVPGENQSSLGYPFTVQAYWGPERAERTLQLAMFVGEGDDPVDCHVITPDAPLFDRLSPKDAYCLIPKGHLAASESYRVTGRCLETGGVFTWRFKTGRR
ncbi:hypothetical protein Poly30_08840 [Planctomycetes bacterium Poly30]|uniref:SCP domain-containing protein n=1 Tax=Saltatorellus ferox TaxID=2528018 RepID=A0A518EMS2_9BACT|nr:hypothetical protein Poly30_08840 [Planctomycetes bacterium Poly30]